MTTAAPPPLFADPPAPSPLLGHPGAKPPAAPVDPPRAGESPNGPRRTPTWWRDVSRPAKKLIAYGVLLVMAGADAFFFYNTLARLLERGVEYLWVFVAALTLGSVLACEVAGRLVKRRRHARGGSITWVVLLVTIWLSLGVGLVWIRSQNSLIERDVTDSGPLADGSADGVALVWWQLPEVQVAGLMLALYLLTGMLTMTFAHQFHDPQTAAERAAIEDYMAYARIEREENLARRVARSEHRDEDT